MKIKTPKDIAYIVKTVRKQTQLTQIKLAQLCGVGTRFIIDLEKGKPTCQLDKTLKVLTNLGINLDFDLEFYLNSKSKNYNQISLLKNEYKNG